jgi:hypothetical protein
MRAERASRTAMMVAYMRATREVAMRVGRIMRMVVAERRLDSKADDVRKG